MLAEVVDAMKTGTYSLKRQSVTYVRGIAQRGPVVTTSIEAVVAPLTGRELERLPEGERSKERRLVLSVSEIRVSADGAAADVLVISGEDWEVETVENWLELAGFYKAVARKVER